MPDGRTRQRRSARYLVSRSLDQCTTNSSKPSNGVHHGSGNLACLDQCYPNGRIRGYDRVTRDSVCTNYLLYFHHERHCSNFICCKHPTLRKKSRDNVARPCRNNQLKPPTLRFSRPFSCDYRTHRVCRPTNSGLFALTHRIRHGISRLYRLRSPNRV